MLKLLCFKASLYRGAVESNVTLLQENLLMRLLIESGNCRSTEGGWLDKRLIQWIVVWFSVWSVFVIL